MEPAAKLDEVDPTLEADWPAIAEWLADAPELEAKRLLWDLMRLRPGVYQDGQVRTFQRPVQVWQAQNGPHKEAGALPPEARSRRGDADGLYLGYGVAGEHLVRGVPGHVLPHGPALVQLGRVPRFHQKRLERVFKAAHVPPGKALTMLKQGLLPVKVRRQLPTLAAGGFLDRGEDLVAFGLLVRGETHLVCALGTE